MGEVIISASGVQYGIVVNSDGSINTNATISGSIVIGSVSASVDSIYVQSGTAFLASGNVFMVSGNPWTGVGSSLVTNFPAAYPGSVSQSTSPWVVVGSVNVDNAVVIGSLGVQNVAGSVNQSIVPWIMTGSMQPYNPIGVGSVFLAGGSLTSLPNIIQTGSVAITSSAPLVQTGSVAITSSVVLGVSGITLAGSFAIANYTNWTGIGSVYASAGSITVVKTTAWDGVGSVLTPNPVYVSPSGTFFISGNVINTGSVAVTSQAVWAGAGSVLISGTFPAWTGIGSILTPNPVYISPSGTFFVSGNVINIGSVAITSSAVLPISGAFIGVSGITLAGSFSISNQPISVFSEQDRRAPDFGFSGALLTTSGLTANIYIPAAGSKALLKSYTISSDVANFVSLKFSGLTTVPIASFYIPASGTITQNLIGAEPSGAANMPVSAGVGAAGNIYVSVFVRSVP